MRVREVNNVGRGRVGWACRVLLIAIIAFPVANKAQTLGPIMIAGHAARFNAAGHLLPWMTARLVSFSIALFGDFSRYAR